MQIKNKQIAKFERVVGMSFVTMMGTIMRLWKYQSANDPQRISFLYIFPATTQWCMGTGKQLDPKCIGIGKTVRSQMHGNRKNS